MAEDEEAHSTVANYTLPAQLDHLNISLVFSFNIFTLTHTHLLVVFRHSFLCISDKEHVCTIFCIRRLSHLIWPGDVETLNPAHRAEEMPNEILVSQWHASGIIWNWEEKGTVLQCLSDPSGANLTIAFSSRFSSFSSHWADASISSIFSWFERCNQHIAHYR